MSKEQQWADLNAFIENDDYLKDRRGQYVEKNHSRVPFMHIFDFRIAQEFYITAGGKRNTLQVSLDIFNFGNLLNKIGAGSIMRQVPITATILSSSSKASNQITQPPGSHSQSPRVMFGPSMI